jgi:hypothetical protein
MGAYSSNLSAAADDGPPSLRCSNLTFWHTSLRQTAPVSFSWKETGAPTAAAAQLVQGFAAFPLVTIGVTNTEVTSNSDADDGAAAHGMNCT